MTLTSTTSTYITAAYTPGEHWAITVGRRWRALGDLDFARKLEQYGRDIKDIESKGVRESCVDPHILKRPASEGIEGRSSKRAKLEEIEADHDSQDLGAEVDSYQEEEGPSHEGEGGSDAEDSRAGADPSAGEPDGHDGADHADGEEPGPEGGVADADGDDAGYSASVQCCWGDCAEVVLRKDCDAHWRPVHRTGANVADVNQKYPCQWVGCDSSSASYQSLVRHVRTVHYIKTPHACDLCGQAFTRADVRNRHRGSEACVP